MGLVGGMVVVVVVLRDSVESPRDRDVSGSPKVVFVSVVPSLRLSPQESDLGHPRV